MSAIAIAVLVAAVASSPAGSAGIAPGDADRAAAAAEKMKKVRFKGKSRNGYPIKFTIVERPGADRVSKLSVDVVTECWSDANHDGVPDKVVAHITGLSGRVSADGTLEVFYSPDEDTEYVVDGRLDKRRAKLNVVVGGYFSADGVPNGGELECDNWGTIYKAKRRGR